MNLADNAVFTVNIITPDGIVYQHHATMLVVRAIDGDLGILANHEPIVAPLQICEARIRRQDRPNHEDAVAVNGGFLEVHDNVASVVADSAERARDIDLRRAELARERAEHELESAKTQHDTDSVRRAQVALRRAINRIEVSKHRHL